MIKKIEPICNYLEHRHKYVTYPKFKKKAEKSFQEILEELQKNLKVKTT